jgi:hypothetical protein
MIFVACVITMEIIGLDGRFTRRRLFCFCGAAAAAAAGDVVGSAISTASSSAAED